MFNGVLIVEICRVCVIKWGRHFVQEISPRVFRCYFYSRPDGRVDLWGITLLGVDSSISLNRFKYRNLDVPFRVLNARYHTSSGNLGSPKSVTGCSTGTGVRQSLYRQKKEFSSFSSRVTSGDSVSECIVSH